MESIESAESTTRASPRATRATSEPSVGRNIVTANRMSATGTSSAPSPKPSLRPSAMACVSSASLVETSETIMATATTMMATPIRSLATGLSWAGWEGRRWEFFFCAFELRFAGIAC